MTTSLRWAANISPLFTERPFLERFDAARDAGFQAVEFWWPRGERLEDVERAAIDSGLEVALINMDAGDLEAGDRGYLNRRECHQEVLAAFGKALSLAEAIGCPRIHTPVGKDFGADRSEQLTAVVEALKRMAEMASGAGILMTLEPLNAIDHPTYLMSSIQAAKDLARRIGPGVALQFDTYHVGAMGDDIVAAVTSDAFAHVQVADYPGRHEPGTGHLPLNAFFDALLSSGYSGYVGLEYIPLLNTETSLQWWRDYGSVHPRDAEMPQAPIEFQAQ
jgi:hydroxypyruvate isomerase